MNNCVADCYHWTAEHQKIRIVYVLGAFGGGRTNPIGKFSLTIHN